MDAGGCVDREQKARDAGAAMEHARHRREKRVAAAKLFALIARVRVELEVLDGIAKHLQDDDWIASPTEATAAMGATVSPPAPDTLSRTT
jgi:hypothetical protein